MEYSTLGILPIDEQNPVGSDIKYDEDFEKIESEISKLTSPTASSEVNWGLVAKLGENILETKSKNLLVSVYLSYALFKMRGVEGLNDGIKVLTDLLEKYWESMYPPLKRLKGRKNAIEWLLGKLNKEFERMDTQEVDAKLKDELLTNLKKIDDFLSEHIEDAPLFYNLVKLVDMKLFVHVETQTQQQVEDVKQEQQNSKPQQTREQPQSSHTSNSDKDIEKDFLALVSSLSLFTGEMIEAKDYRSELFVVNRAFAWLDIQDVPSSANHKTMLPPPDTQEMEIIQKLYGEKDFDSLLWAAESRITTYLFWLDLHFYVAESLRNLGHIQASQSVLEQTRYFVTKLPGLEDLTFSDSTPFANKATKKWLKSKEKETSEAVLESSKEDKQDSVEIVECSPEGIDKLSKLMRGASCVEEEVLYNIEICKCLAKSGNETLNTTYTKKLLDRIEEYGVERWKPEMALESYLASIECLGNVAQNEELVEQLYKKVALIRPSLVDL